MSIARDIVQNYRRPGEVIARRAFGVPRVNVLMGASLMGLIFVAPLLFYLLAFVTYVIGRALGGQGSAFQHRLALFWSLLAASPLALLNGLVAGFVGPGAQLTAVGALWFAAFMWFWSSGLWHVSKKVVA